MLSTYKYYGTPRIKLYKTFLSLIYLLFTPHPVLLFVHKNINYYMSLQKKIIYLNRIHFLLCNLYIYNLMLI